MLPCCRLCYQSLLLQSPARLGWAGSGWSGWENGGGEGWGVAAVLLSQKQLCCLHSRLPAHLLHSFPTCWLPGLLQANLRPSWLPTSQLFHLLWSLGSTPPPLKTTHTQILCLLRTTFYFGGSYCFQAGLLDFTLPTTICLCPASSSGGLSLFQDPKHVPVHSLGHAQRARVASLPCFPSASSSL